MSALVDALQKGQVTGDCTLAAVLDGPEVGSRMLLRGGCPVWQTHSSGVLQRSLSRLQECTATGFLELDGTRVFAERFGAVPQIVVCGGGHVAVSVVRLAKLLGLPVLAMEDRTEYAQDLRDAGADTVLCLPFAQALEQVPGGAETYFVVVTRAHAFDVACLEQILQKPAAYVGMMAAGAGPHWYGDSCWKPGRMLHGWKLCRPPSDLPSGPKQPKRSRCPFWRRSWK